MKQKPELKPCPFCGSKATLHRDSWEDRPGHKAVAYWVRCAPCGSCSAEHHTPEKAAAAWNRRVDDAEK